MHDKVNRLGGVLVAALLALAGSAQAQMYKCVDAKGASTYSDKPCLGTKGTEIDRRPNAPKGSLPQKKSAAANTDEAQQARCHSMRLDRVRLATGDPIVMRKPTTGERVVMDDATRKKRLAEIDRELRKCK